MLTDRRERLTSLREFCFKFLVKNFRVFWEDFIFFCRAVWVLDRAWRVALTRVILEWRRVVVCWRLCKVDWRARRRVDRWCKIFWSRCTRI